MARVVQLELGGAIESLENLSGDFGICEFELVFLISHGEVSS
jgi:hypothetical protein